MSKLEIKEFNYITYGSTQSTFNVGYCYTDDGNIAEKTEKPAELSHLVTQTFFGNVGKYNSMSEKYNSDRESFYDVSNDILIHNIYPFQKTRLQSTTKEYSQNGTNQQKKRIIVPNISSDFINLCQFKNYSYGLTHMTTRTPVTRKTVYGEYQSPMKYYYNYQLSNDSIKTYLYTDVSSVLNLGDYAQYSQCSSYDELIADNMELSSEILKKIFMAYRSLNGLEYNYFVEIPYEGEYNQYENGYIAGDMFLAKNHLNYLYSMDYSNTNSIHYELESMKSGSDNAYVDITGVYPDNYTKIVVKFKPLEDIDVSQDQFFFGVVKSGGGGKYRYVKLEISNIWGGNIMQISRLDFIDQNGNRFPYSVSSKAETNCTGHSGEGVENILKEDTNTKYCCPFSQLPIVITIDLGTECLDPDVYNRWQWWTANDTKSYSERNPKDFTLYLSNNKSDWIKVDTQTNYTKQETNKEIGYTGNININNVERTVDEGEIANDYRLFNSNNLLYFDIGDRRLSGDEFDETIFLHKGEIYEFEFGNFYVKDLTNGGKIYRKDKLSYYQSETVLKWLYGGAKAELYYMQVYERYADDDETLLMDLIPVLKIEDNSVCLYDRVGGKYYCSSGGTFERGQIINVQQLKNCREYCNLNVCGNELYATYRTNVGYSRTEQNYNVTYHGTGAQEDLGTTIINEDYKKVTNDYSYQHVEVIDNIQKWDMNGNNGHKSSMFSLRLNDTGLNSSTIPETVKEKLRQNVRNGVRAAIEQITPANTQLFEIYFEGL